ncbi:hypothetical protein LSG31_10345 [Fodinisporobacter ferrooxydans]|uniref:CRISPR-associated protein n=1 Tax=Fodinisporobacter ferrooxydans TaxID=2901836 RepID=A0ABY4CQ40_9BACL|nr:hypothetical protein LSG31_10345 [Alicyclobacillaceae bacterium MYW30-H2]
MAIVLMNIGNSDIQPERKRLTEKERRDSLSVVLEDLKSETQVLDDPQFPILSSVEKYLLNKGEKLSFLVLFYTRQQSESFGNSDTYLDFEIIQLAIAKKKLFLNESARVIGIPIQEVPYSYDHMLIHYRKAINLLEEQFNFEGTDFGQTLFISMTGGTPACNFGLLHAIHEWKKFRTNKKFIYSPRPAKDEEQPPAIDIQVNTYLSLKEVLRNLNELFEGNHYGQVKTLLKNLSVVDFNHEDVFLFLDALLMRRNQQYQRSIETLNKIRNTDFRDTLFFKSFFNQVRELIQGISIHETIDSKWLKDISFKKLLEEQYWKLVNYYHLEEYNEWTTLLMTFYENLLKIKVITLLGPQKFNKGNFSVTLRNEYTSLLKDSSDNLIHQDNFLSNNSRYPNRRTYQNLISVVDPLSLLREPESSFWVSQLEKIHKKRNELIHEFGGLNREMIEQVFLPKKWDQVLKKVLVDEFYLNIDLNPLTPIHSGFLDWIENKLLNF